MSDDARFAPGAVAAATTIPGVATDLSPGVVVGEYRIEGVVGRGGMGVVYGAVHPVIEKKVAIKVLAAQFSSTPDLVRRFVDEARAVNRIGHENIIDIFSFGQLPDGRHYFVMEYLEGATLATRLERNDLAAADLPILLAQICDGLEAAHAKKIIHRDLKPENVWIGASNRGLRVRLLDFGIAKLLDTGDQMVTDVGTVIGTPHFMSPEQCNGHGVDHRTDIYAMGVIMYRIFAGRLPINGQTFAEILAKQITETPPPPSTLASLPGALDQLIVRCLKKDPILRPQSAQELATTLATIFAAGPPLGSAPSAAITPAVGAITPAMALHPTEVSGSAPAAAAAAVVVPTGRRPMALLLVLAAIVVAGVAFGLLARRSTPAMENAAAIRPPNGSPTPRAAPASPPGMPSPADTAAVAPPVPPSVQAEAAPSSPPPVGKRRADGEPRAPGKPPAAKAGASRASRSGLVTENPFE